jgi:[ribosomal protein S5]-alanine N-acetyltransferase
VHPTGVPTPPRRGFVEVPGMKRRSVADDVVLRGRRVLLRPLVAEDFPAWREVRRANAEWLAPWEPARMVSHPDVIEDPQAFALRCDARSRERQMGTGFGFGIFVGDDDTVPAAEPGAAHLVGEINLSSVQRGAFQSGYVGYWMDQRHAGRGYMPEAVVVLAQHAFGDLRLHRLQISIIPRNERSRRVVEKLGVRSEGIALRYLEINGVWEDHVRYAITAEEWAERRAEWLGAWVDPLPPA